jgi:hypothetical protein
MAWKLTYVVAAETRDGPSRGGTRIGAMGVHQARPLSTETDMNIVADFLMPALAFGTLLAFTIFGYVSAQKTKERKRHHTPKSTLAADGNPHGRPIDT